MAELTGRKVDLPSGATFYPKPASYIETEELLGNFLENVAGFPLLNEDLTISEERLKMFAETTVAKVFTRPSLKAAMWKCLGYCLYIKRDGTAPEKVSPHLFETIANRQDLPIVFYECAYENLSPFVAGLYSVSKTLEDKVRSTQK